jgi:MoaA/NifB/PqqE/SkfB family radical SAM enzyme
LDLTGGEPFLVRELPTFFHGVCRLKHRQLKVLQSIAITTNGFLTRRVLEVVESALPRLAARRVDLVVVCAMDGVGPIHETIRNVPHAWEKVHATIQGLRGLRSRFSNLVIGLKTTILPINVSELDKIAAYAHENGLFTIISPRILTPGRYLNMDRGPDLSFSAADISRMIRFYRGEGAGWRYHGDQMIRFLQTGRLHKTCSCGFNYFFVRSNGELFLCPLMDTGLGNLTEKPVKELLTSREALTWRRRIGRHPVCRTCTEPGLERYSLPYQGFRYLLLLLRMGWPSFFEMHRHMGLDKYF